MPAIRRRWTTDDVRALTNEERAWPRYELIDGELLVTPAPGSNHQIAVYEILVLVGAYLEREPVGVIFMSPADLELKPGTITQPDVFVVPVDIPLKGEHVQWPDVQSLLLAIEIVSPSSVRTDRGVKRRFYLDAGVPDYWVVDLDARQVERWRAGDEAPEIERERIVWAPSAESELAVDLPPMFDRIERKARLLRPPSQPDGGGIGREGP